MVPSFSCYNVREARPIVLLSQVEIEAFLIESVTSLTDSLCALISDSKVKKITLHFSSPPLSPPLVSSTGGLRFVLNQQLAHDV